MGDTSPSVCEQDASKKKRPLLTNRQGRSIIRCEVELPSGSHTHFSSYGYSINLMEKHLFRPILIACDTIITRVQGSVGCHV